jgi:hypothetical protein
MNLPHMLPQVIPSHKSILSRPIATRDIASMRLGSRMILLMALQLVLSLVVFSASVYNAVKSLWSVVISQRERNGSYSWNILLSICYSRWDRYLSQTWAWAWIWGGRNWFDPLVTCQLNPTMMKDETTYSPGDWGTSPASALKRDVLLSTLKVGCKLMLKSLRFLNGKLGSIKSKSKGSKDNFGKLARNISWESWTSRWNNPLGDVEFWSWQVTEILKIIEKVERIVWNPKVIE